MYELMCHNWSMAALILQQFIQVLITKMTSKSHETLSKLGSDTKLFRLTIELNNSIVLLRDTISKDVTKKENQIKPFRHATSVRHSRPRLV